MFFYNYNKKVYDAALQWNLNIIKNLIEREALNPEVDDEIDKRLIVDFIQQVYPELKNLAIVHSSSDKVFSEVAEVVKACKPRNIVLRRFMVQNLADLYGISKALPADTQAIFILKDNLVASGVDTLVQEASKRKIPVITSDDGTVKQGAAFAIGVHERDIGSKGAKIAARILQGAHPSQIASVKLTKPTIFVNSKIVNDVGDFRKLKLAAKKPHYPLEVIQQCRGDK